MSNKYTKIMACPVGGHN